MLGDGWKDSDMMVFRDMKFGWIHDTTHGLMMLDGSTQTP